MKENFIYKINYKKVELLKVERTIEGGKRHLKKMLEMFVESVYNAQCNMRSYSMLSFL